MEFQILIVNGIFTDNSLLCIVLSLLLWRKAQCNILFLIFFSFFRWKDRVEISYTNEQPVIIFILFNEQKIILKSNIYILFELSSLGNKVYFLIKMRAQTIYLKICHNLLNVQLRCVCFLKHEWSSFSKSIK